MKREGQEIGSLIKELRKSKGMSQMGLAEIVGVSYQQIQKYEKGIDNLNIIRLRQIAAALDVPATFFLTLGSDRVAEARAVYGKPTDEEQFLLKLFRGIKDKKMRKTVIEFLKAVSKQE